MGKIPDLQVEMDTNWNHRYRENMERLKSGDLLEVAKVAKGLMLRDARRGLSTGERKMLHSARQILISEIGLAQSISYQEAEDRMEKELTHELIVVIANQGATDRVMDAARAAGATGGTAVHAKGTGTELAKKFFGVSLAAEKELIFILSAAETRKPIMKAIMEKAGMQTDAQALAFSLPVTDLAGLRQFGE